MADLDIMPWKSAHGGHTDVEALPLDGAASFLRGEPVLIDAGGQVNKSATEPDIRANPPTVYGIAAVSAQGIADHDGDGTIANSANSNVSVYPFREDIQFFTRNIFNVAPTALVPTVANIGDSCALALFNGSWGVDVGATAGVENFIIKQLIDAEGKDAVVNSTTAVGVVFSLSPATV